MRKLGILEFTGTDVFQATEMARALVCPGTTDSNDALALELNQVLESRIQLLPEVFTTSGHAWLTDPMGYAKKRARLLCVEEN